VHQKLFAVVAGHELLGLVNQPFFPRAAHTFVKLCNDVGFFFSA
jgi:hypothetical protein